MTGKELIDYIQKNHLEEHEMAFQIEGEWLEEHPNTYTSRVYCSVCGQSAPFISVTNDYFGANSHGEIERTKHCPNCGAKMET